jgi:hypothetical protein
MRGNLDMPVTSQFVHANGSTPWTGNQSMGGNHLTHVSDPSLQHDIVNVQTLTELVGLYSNTPKVVRADIPSGNTAIILNKPALHPIKLTFRIECGLKICAFEGLFAGTGANIYATLGDDINFSITPTESGGNLTISVTNNEADILVVKYIFLPM